MPPNSSSLPQKPRQHIWLIAGSLTLVLGVALQAQLGRMTVLSNFKIIERFSPKEMLPGQTNQTKTVLTGAKARQQPGGLILVDQMRIDSLQPDGGTNIIARAPECVFDFVERVAQSTGRLEVASADGQYRISGQQGFACWLTNTYIILSNHVRTEIHHSFIPTVTP